MRSIKEIAAHSGLEKITEALRAGQELTLVKEDEDEDEEEH